LPLNLNFSLNLLHLTGWEGLLAVAAVPLLIGVCVEDAQAAGINPEMSPKRRIYLVQHKGEWVDVLRRAAEGKLTRTLYNTLVPATSDGYMPTAEAYSYMGYQSPGQVATLAKKGKIPGAVFLEGHWSIPTGFVQERAQRFRQTVSESLIYEAMAEVYYDEDGPLVGRPVIRAIIDKPSQALADTPDKVSKYFRGKPTLKITIAGLRGRGDFRVDLWDMHRLGRLVREDCQMRSQAKTLQELADMSGVPVTTLRRWRQEGELDAVLFRFNGRCKSVWVVPEEGLPGAIQYCKTHRGIRKSRVRKATPASLRFFSADEQEGDDIVSLAGQGRLTPEMIDSLKRRRRFGVKLGQRISAIAVARRLNVQVEDVVYHCQKLSSDSVTRKGRRYQVTVGAANQYAVIRSMRVPLKQAYDALGPLLARYPQIHFSYRKGFWRCVNNPVDFFGSGQEVARIFGEARNSLLAESPKSSGGNQWMDIETLNALAQEIKRQAETRDNSRSASELEAERAPYYSLVYELLRSDKLPHELFAFSNYRKPISVFTSQQQSLIPVAAAQYQFERKNPYYDISSIASYGLVPAENGAASIPWQGTSLDHNGLTIECAATLEVLGREAQAVQAYFSPAQKKISLCLRTATGGSAYELICLRLYSGSQIPLNAYPYEIASGKVDFLSVWMRQERGRTRALEAIYERRLRLVEHALAEAASFEGLIAHPKVVRALPQEGEARTCSYTASFKWLNRHWFFDTRTTSILHDYLFGQDGRSVLVRRYNAASSCEIRLVEPDNSVSRSFRITLTPDRGFTILDQRFEDGRLTESSEYIAQYKGQPVYLSDFRYSVFVARLIPETGLFGKDAPKTRHADSGLSVVKPLTAEELSELLEANHWYMPMLHVILRQHVQGRLYTTKSILKIIECLGLIEVFKEGLLGLFSRHRYSRKDTAAILGVAPETLGRWIVKLELEEKIREARRILARKKKEDRKARVRMEREPLPDAETLFRRRIQQYHPFDHSVQQALAWRVLNQDDPAARAKLMESALPLVQAVSTSVYFAINCRVSSFTPLPNLVDVVAQCNLILGAEFLGWCQCCARQTLEEYMRPRLFRGAYDYLGGCIRQARREPTEIDAPIFVRGYHGDFRAAYSGEDKLVACALWPIESWIEEFGGEPQEAEGDRLVKAPQGPLREISDPVLSLGMNHSWELARAVLAERRHTDTITLAILDADHVTDFYIREGEELAAEYLERMKSVIRTAAQGIEGVDVYDFGIQKETMVIVCRGSTVEQRLAAICRVAREELPFSVSIGYMGLDEAVIRFDDDAMGIDEFLGFPPERQMDGFIFGVLVGMYDLVHEAKKEDLARDRVFNLGEWFQADDYTDLEPCGVESSDEG
jgi:DNA-binding transcriptional MerR regulator